MLDMLNAFSYSKASEYLLSLKLSIPSLAELNLTSILLNVIEI